MIELPSSIPSISEYEELLTSDLFYEIEEYSNSFIQKNEQFLIPYAKKWVSDPLHQWNRQWEYAYVYSRMISGIPRQNKVILDAGSGITFFPYFIKTKLNPINILCGDIDPSLKSMFTRINKRQQQSIEFIQFTLDNISCENESVDLVYCISVIEHTQNYQGIIDEFFRILKSGGRLLLTFDISIDGKASLSPSNSEFLLEYVNSKFRMNHEKENLLDLLSSTDLLTTKYAYEKNPSLLPWKRNSFVKDFPYMLFNKKPMKKYSLFSLYCLEAVK